jgi:hypothetical protein
MSIESVQAMIKTGRVQLTNVQLIWHYVVVVIFFIPPLMHLWYVFQFYVLNSYDGVYTLSDLAKWSYLSLIPALILYFTQRIRLRFKEIPVVVNSDVFLEAVEQTAVQKKWEIVSKKAHIVTARTDYTWQSWGELITVVRDNDKVLFNSICDPDNHTSIASWGRSRENFEAFKSILFEHISSSKK